jgi:uncharacterized membrane protein YqaE (UPF0057 family)
MLNILLAPLNPIVQPLISLGIAIIQMVNFMIELAQMIPKIINIVLLFLDPGKLLKDIIFGATTGIYMVVEALFDIIFGKVRQHMGGKTSKGSNKGGINNQKCLPPSITQILILVLCPPLYVVLSEGLFNSAGFFPVILTSILTYFYYFPGLIYASLFTFC